MFWIGLIVGIVIGAIAYLSYSTWQCTKQFNCSFWELSEMLWIVKDVGQNREAALACIKDDEIMSEYTLEEK